MDGRPVRLHGDWYRIAEAMAWAKKTYGLTPVARGGPRGTAERRATRAETEKAAREYKKAGRIGRPVPTRTMLRRLVEQAVAAARTETEFFDGLAARGVAVRLRCSTVRPTEVTGYAVGLPSDTTGVDNGPARCCAPHGHPGPKTSSSPSLTGPDCPSGRDPIRPGLIAWSATPSPCPAWLTGQATRSGSGVAQHAAGRGLATATVRELCRLAAARHGLRALRAATSRENTPSRKVLTKAGFVPAGPADPAHIGGKQGTWYQRDLATGDTPQQRAAARDQAGD
jgi:ribosomal-protein-alanine N-acetyltransferase